MHVVQAFPSPHPPALNPRGRILHPLHPAAPCAPKHFFPAPSQKQLHPGRYKRCVRRLVVVKTPLTGAIPGRTLELTSSVCCIGAGQSAFPAAVSVGCQQ